MRYTLLGITVVAFLMTSSTAFAQIPREKGPDEQRAKPVDPGNRELELDRKAMEKNSKRVEKSLNHPRTPNKTTSTELTPEQKRLLSPTQEDLARFEAFLNLPDTGLIRLFPKGKFEYSLNVVSASDSKQVTTLPITGGGAAYSFTKKKHEMTEWSEIAFQDGMLFSGFAGGVLGFMANLGDVPLESVSLKTTGVDYLQDLARPRNRSEAIVQSKRNHDGFMAGGVTYYSVLAVVPGSTYVLRSVAEGRIDTLIAFRVCRKDEDGSLIILWRRLKKDSAPLLK